ncbi:hypothetical protein JCGZ_19451 [Jatropha curcas]|uniref:SHSP domain-containing protein n=1 Tax=Jatropha curcas TaxID=180498 RepID=A0A067K2N6_JATCU|nr:hypothetical protein JCGZ_19451 [Jatropha curcas]
MTDGIAWSVGEAASFRRFKLPENADTDEIKCSLENGVLSVLVPKKHAEQSQRNVRYIDLA